ncbi:MAG: right-handed parallel beta-helix repeat-containing protein [Candidatus Hermodarchaeota archaeon]
MKIPEKFRNRKLFIILIIVLFGVPATLLTGIFFFISLEEPNGTIVAEGTLTEDTTWKGHVIVQSDVLVPNGITLTVLPGTFVEFKHFRGYKNISRVGLFVDGGTIRAVGLPDQQIWFTSDAEDPINADWSGIVCKNTNNSIFEYVIVEFSIIGIEFSKANISISHSIIRWIHTEGIYAAESYGLIEYSLLYGNGYHEIAAEEFNYDLMMQYNIFNGGHYGILTEATNSTVIGNYFVNYSGDAITVTSTSNISIIENKFENITMAKIFLDPTVTAITSGNDLFGNGTVPIPILDFPDPKTRELGYVPGDPEDRYLYVYDTVDETRIIINRLENETSFDWTLTYVNGCLWKFKHKSTDIGDSKNFVKINITSESIEEFGNDDVLNPNGLAYDGQYFWTYDIVYKTIIKFKINSTDYLEVIDTFPLPSEIGSSAGIATDGTYLYLPGSDGTKLYKLNKSATVIETINLSGGTIFGALTLTGSHFWVAAETELSRWTLDGSLVGKIYPAAEGTIGITWDGTYLWTSCKTCEVWLDGKIFQIEIIDDQIML